MKYERLKLALIIFFCFQFCLLILFLFYILGRERFSIKKIFAVELIPRDWGLRVEVGLRVRSLAT